MPSASDVHKGHPEHKSNLDPPGYIFPLDLSLPATPTPPSSPPSAAALPAVSKDQLTADNLKILQDQLDEIAAKQQADEKEQKKKQDEYQGEGEEEVRLKSSK